MELLTVPSKKPNEVDFVKPLKNLQNNSSADFLEKVNYFNKQRQTAVFKIFEKSESALEVISA